MKEEILYIQSLIDLNELRLKKITGWVSFSEDSEHFTIINSFHIDKKNIFYLKEGEPSNESFPTIISIRKRSILFYFFKNSVLSREDGPAIVELYLKANKVNALKLLNSYSLKPIMEIKDILIAPDGTYSFSSLMDNDNYIYDGEKIPLKDICYYNDFLEVKRDIDAFVFKRKMYERI